MLKRPCFAAVLRLIYALKGCPQATSKRCRVQKDVFSSSFEADLCSKGGAPRGVETGQVQKDVFWSSFEADLCSKGGPPRGGEKGQVQDHANGPRGSPKVVRYEAGFGPPEL